MVHANIINDEFVAVINHKSRQQFFILKYSYNITL